MSGELEALLKLVSEGKLTAEARAGGGTQDGWADQWVAKDPLNHDPAN